LGQSSQRDQATADGEGCVFIMTARTSRTKRGAPSILPGKVADVVEIDKQRRGFKLTQVFFGENDDLLVAGNCKEMEVDKSP
jgi:hypothetical protein